MATTEMLPPCGSGKTKVENISNIKARAIIIAVKVIFLVSNFIKKHLQ
jgi:hypothetical protein